jgi:hypothetical protein
VKRAIAIVTMLAGAALGQWDASPILSVLNRSQADTLTVYAKTTGAGESVVLAAIKSSVACTVSWGDGAVSNLAAATTYSSLTHVYATAGTYPVVVASASKLTVLNLDNSKWAGLKSAELRASAGMTDFRYISVGSHASGSFASSDVSAWRPDIFYLYSMPAGYGGTFNSSDVSAWRPGYFRLYSMPAGYGGTFNSSDVSAWRPTLFYLFSMPAGYGGTFNSSDVSAWRPNYFYLLSMPSGYAGAFNSSDVSAWRPDIFYLSSMPAGYGGTFNSSDVAAWRPSYFYLLSMPSGYAGAFNSSDVSAWRPSYFWFYSMPAGYGGTFNSSNVSAWRPSYFRLSSMPAGYGGTFSSSDATAWNPTHFYLHTMATNFTFTHSAGGFTNFLATTVFQMQSMGMSTSTVDAVLWDLYRASKAPRTGSAGSIDVGGSNSDPSGTYQAASSCPVTGSTPGKEIAYELKNDNCGAGFNKWTTVSY